MRIPHWPLAASPEAILPNIGHGSRWNQITLQEHAASHVILLSSVQGSGQPLPTNFWARICSRRVSGEIKLRLHVCPTYIPAVTPKTYDLCGNPETSHE